MSDKYRSERESEQELDPISSLFSELVDPEDEEEEFRSEFFQGLSGRRKKAAFVLMAIWAIAISLHLLAWGTWVVLGASGLIAIQGLRLLMAKPQSSLQPLSDETLANAPSVALLVAAKNEESVIGKLMTQLCNLDYPSDKYEVWAIDDRSTDRTPQILDKLAQQYPQLKVIRRPANAEGGKSGALNQVLPLTQCEIVGVFDADAGVPKDLLRHVAPMFDAPEIGAVQVSKAIANESINFWTRGQATEMALDGYFQQQRIALGGIGELRGNGQFARRSALESCGGWNEQTITDDLDLTIRLHLDNWDIGFLLAPAVEEEGVTSATSLWHQRNRWAEGGYQRYLDYWRFILKNRMGTRKTIDLFVFWLLQYVVPTAAIPDFLMAIARHRLMLTSPISAMTLLLFMFSAVGGLRRVQKINAKKGWRLASPKGFDFSLFVALLQSLRGTIYMLHWLAIVSSTTFRMSIRPKRLKWVKTVHRGADE
jgi:1,2-diacylglycerol 3-beta-glucosyltransferase